MKPVKYTFEVKQTATLRIDVVGYDIVHAQERIIQLMQDEDETISELVSSQGEWETSWCMIRSSTELDKKMEHGYWDVHKD